VATDYLFDGPEDAPLTVALAHGAGAQMDSGAVEESGIGKVGT